ncbi:MAG: DinB family protein [Acidothermales bacterium]|nr:DinB family protein [Acidothermales bacterium]
MSVVDRQAIHDEMDRVVAQFRRLVRDASASELSRRSDGTRWTNQELLFHMLFGYLIVRALLGMVRTAGRLPDAVGRTFAATLNAGTRPFHVVNYLGSCGGARVFHGGRLAAKFDRTVASLHRHLDAESDTALEREMHFPVRWDPYFRDVMSLADVYRYGTRHFEHHRRQLTLP